MLSLQCVEHHEVPFHHVTLSKVFDASRANRLLALFSPSSEWQARDDSFYRCFLREVTRELPQPWLRALARAMRSLTGLPLTQQVSVTAQRMDPGQAIGVHSDRPLVGYEIARLVAFIGATSSSDAPPRGGVLELYGSPPTSPVRSIPPKPNTAFAFVLDDNSHHAVTEALDARHSLVFNFWHAANTKELALAVGNLFDEASFAELPQSLDPIAERADRDHTEAVSQLAHLTALALHRWGLDEALVKRGFEWSLRRPSSDARPRLASDGEVEIALAEWAARLHVGSFELDRWDELSAMVGDARVPESVRSFRELAVPSSARKTRDDASRRSGSG